MLFGGVAALAVAALAWWQLAGPADAGIPPIDPDDGEQVALGERVYAQACAACHGANLEGEPNWRERGADGLLPAPPHDETGHTWHHSREQLFLITRDGVEAYAPEGYRSAMPGFADQLSEAEIAASIAYIMAQWPDEVRAAHAQREQAMAR